MLPSVISNLIWGCSPQREEPEQEPKVNVTAQEETGDWLLISCQNSCDPSASANQANTECDLDSVCSDSSWVITPAPTFQRSAGSTHNGDPLEDLLIEHPAMSVYRQNSNNEAESVNAEMEVVDEATEQRNQNRELAMLQNRQRQQLAAHMQIPLDGTKRPPTLKNGSGKPPKLTRRALKRHDPMARLGVKHQVQKCGFKAGRRRC